MARNKKTIVAPYEVFQYTHEQMVELNRCRKDPIYFISTYCKVQHPIRGIIPLELYDYQERMIRSYQENRYSIVLSARQTGKALPLSTPIATPQGWTTMGQITVGDVVFGADGEPTSVTSATEVMENHNCYNISLTGNENIVADEDHQWTVFNTSTNTEITLTTLELYNNPSTYKIEVAQSINLPECELPIDPYTLGVWLGDGQSDDGRITAHRDDLEIMQHISDAGYNIKTRYPRHDDVSRTTVYDLYPSLRIAGLLKNKHIPIEYLRSSHNQRMELLRGLMDTDGTCSKTGSSSIGLSDKKLADDVYQLICSLGLKPSKRIVKTTHKDSTRMIFTAYRDTHEVFKLKRKLARQPATKTNNATSYRKITNVSKVDSVPVRCITVDNSRSLFLAGKAMIPTHNSTVSSAYLYWFSAFHPGKTVLIVANKEDLAKEMVGRIRLMYEMTPSWLKPGVMDDGWNKHSVAFDNRSRILSEATSSDSGRGYPVSLLYCDEFAFVKPGIQEEFWTSISPTISTGGSCIISSTPNGNSNLFAKLWRGAQNEHDAFSPIRVFWTEPPGRDEKFKQDETDRIGEHKWRQEYECEFLSSDRLLINSMTLNTLESGCVPPVLTTAKYGFEFWKPLMGGTTYLIGLDPSTGSGDDFSVIQIVEFPSFEQVGQFRNNEVSTPFVYLALKSLLLQIENIGGRVYFSVENNGIGEGIIALYEADETPPEEAEFISEVGKNRLGMTTTFKSKMKACLALKQFIENGTLTFKSEILLEELKTFVRKNKSFEAQVGANDDTVSAMLIVIRLIEEIATFEDAAFETMYQVTDRPTYEDEHDYEEPDSIVLV